MPSTFLPSVPKGVQRTGETTGLKRDLGFFLLLSYGVGNILGAGIYVLVGEVASTSGMFAPIAFIAAALVAVFTGLSYAELAVRFPVSAGEAVYVNEAFSDRTMSIVIGLLVSISGIVSSATLIRGFIGYLNVFVALPDVVPIVLLLGVTFFIAIVGIKKSVAVAAIFTALEIVGLLTILWVTRGAMAELPERLPELVPSLSLQPWIGITAGAFLAFFAFIGFEDMVNVAEEVKRPSKTIPRAIIVAIVMCSLLYGLISLAAVLQVRPEILGESLAPLAYVYQDSTGREPVFLSVLSLFAIANGILIQVIMVSRIIYGMTRKGWLPAFLGQINERFKTPVSATGVVTLSVFTLAVFFPLGKLASFTSLGPSDQVPYASASVSAR